MDTETKKRVIHNALLASFWLIVGLLPVGYFVQQARDKAREEESLLQCAAAVAAGWEKSRKIILPEIEACRGAQVKQYEGDPPYATVRRNAAAVVYLEGNRARVALAQEGF